MSARTWTLEGLVEHFRFVHEKMRDHKFVWVLGAGASLASNIPSGSQLVDKWLSEMCLREVGIGHVVSEWANAKTLEIAGFKYSERASHYSSIYRRRFSDYPDEGYAYLESLMSDKDPSPGYSILAATLASEPARHNAVITTNFDNLVSDALSIYTNAFPFVCGHESLTSYIHARMRRPLICKIHRDLLLGPQNEPRHLRRLHDAWGTALREVLKHYTPIVIGYGGNDDTLMDLLESMDQSDIKGQMIWCCHESTEPSQRIASLVEQHSGILVKTPGFDHLMLILGGVMEIKLLDEQLLDRAAERAARYRNRILRLDGSKHAMIEKVLLDTIARTGGWWVWEQNAQAESDLSKRKAIYVKGIAHLKDSSELVARYAWFLNEEMKDYAESEKMRQQAIEMNPGYVLSKIGEGYRAALRENYEEAVENLKEAEFFNASACDEASVGILIDRGLIALIQREEHSDFLRLIGSLFHKKLDGTTWTFEELLTLAMESVRDRDDELEIYTMVVAAFVANQPKQAAIARIEGYLEWS